MLYVFLDLVADFLQFCAQLYLGAYYSTSLESLSASGTFTLGLINLLSMAFAIRWARAGQLDFAVRARVTPARNAPAP